MVIAEGSLDRDGRPVLVLAKRTAFTPAEEAAALAHLRKYPNLAAHYLPSQPGDNPFSRLIRSGDPIAFSRGYEFNVTPVDDNAPFFFFTLKLEQMLTGRVAHSIDWKVNLGVVVLAAVLVLSFLAVSLFLILPLILKGGWRKKRLLPLMYFVLLGLGYILIEIAFIQRFVLFLGHPIYALTVVVFLMLLSSGMGSVVSRRWLVRRNPQLGPLGVVAITILIYLFLLPFILNLLVGMAFPLKITISALLLVPLAFAMGMPFPLGLRALTVIFPSDALLGEHTNDNSVEWAWAMNAASSVLGSVLAIAITVRFGLNVTLACGGAAYAAAMVFSRLGFRRA
jgi:hypothetical protein